MIRRTVLLLALAGLGLAGCSSNNAMELSGPDAIAARPGGMKIGAEVSLAGLDATLRFEDVLSDSRCPVDVTCVWEGNARISLSIIEASGNVIAFNLNTSTNAATDNGQVRFVFRDHEISIAGLLPETRTDRKISADQYRLEIAIDK